MKFTPQEQLDKHTVELAELVSACTRQLHSKQRQPSSKESRERRKKKKGEKGRKEGK